MAYKTTILRIKKNQKSMRSLFLIKEERGGANDADDAPALGVHRPCGGKGGADDADAAPALDVLRLLWREGSN